MQEKDFIAYQGEHFTIEWYFDPKGSSQSLEFFEAMSNSQKRKLLMLFKGSSGFPMDTSLIYRNKKVSKSDNYQSF